MFPADDVAAWSARAGALYRDFLAGLAARRVAPAMDHKELEALFTGTLGEEGVGGSQTLLDFEERVLPHAMATPHPLYAGLVNSPPLPMGPVADLLVSMLNNNSGAAHQSPATTACETEVLRLFARLLGMPAGTGGMVLPGGSYANLQGLLLARAKAFPEWRVLGPAAVPGRPLVYCSAAAHFSVVRAAQVAGVGEDNVIAIPVVGRGAMDAAALRERVAADRAAGEVPFCAVATSGTTGTGAFDPLPKIGAVCREHGLWLHVDACYGGVAALVPGLQQHLAGIEVADSVAVDPHKAFFVPMTAGLLLTRHPEVEQAAFGVEASYIPGNASDAYRRGLPTSRRGTALTIWMTLRAHGLAAVRAACERNIAQCRRLEEALRGRGFEVLAGGEFSIANVRRQGTADDQQVEIARRIAASGRAWFSVTRHGDRTWLRINWVNWHTRDEHVDALVEALCGERPSTDSTT